MKTKMYSLFDGAAQAFNKPFYMINDGMAIRAIQGVVNSTDPQDMIATNPHDFTLFQLGEFDDTNATFELLAAPRKVVLAIELVDKDKPKYTNADMEKVLNRLDEIDKNLRGKQIPSILKEQTV